MSDDPLHQEIILDHYRNPRGRGLRAPFEVQVHHVNPTCGDEIDLRVHLTKDADGRVVVSDVSYDGQGCSISQASASVLAAVLAAVAPVSAVAAAMPAAGTIDLVSYIVPSLGSLYATCIDRKSIYSSSVMPRASTSSYS